LQEIHIAVVWAGLVNVGYWHQEAYSVPAEGLLTEAVLKRACIAPNRCPCPEAGFYTSCLEAAMGLDRAVTGP
jgi:hypothetical protein